MVNSTFFTSLIGKAVAKLSRIKGGHGSALPGLIVEKLDPHFLAKVLKTLPRGVAVISGTNGKTTTTKMVVELLREAGLRVFTNDSGSNFTRGVASAAIREIRHGKLNYDIAVLELDEAHAVRFVREIPPDYSLLLNVLRDQLDRFGEIDMTAKMLNEIAKTTSRKLVLNANDPRISALAKSSQAAVSCFGFANNLRELFPTDEELHDKNSKLSSSHLLRGSREKDSRSKSENDGNFSFANDEIILEKVENSHATFQIGGENFVANMAISGAHNFLNAAAALSFAKAILGEKFDARKSVETVSRSRAAFGRGENFVLKNGQKIALNLVKNPAGFRLVLQSADAKIPTLIVINDAYADGRDVSWLYDVDFAKFRENSQIFVSGIRAFDMALRLEYDDVKVREIDTEIRESLLRFLNQNEMNLQIFATYTAMLEMRKILKQEIR